MHSNELIYQKEKQRMYIFKNIKIHLDSLHKVNGEDKRKKVPFALIVLTQEGKEKGSEEEEHSSTTS